MKKILSIVFFGVLAQSLSAQLFVSSNGNVGTRMTALESTAEGTNATIKNNTDIIIDFNNNTIFNGEFKVEVGSSLLVR